MADLIFPAATKQPTAREEVGAPSIAFVTLGCKVNQSDTQKAVADFRGAGFRIVPPHSPADVYVVNTCSVTHIADRKSRQWLRRSARANPSALVVATGCYAESGREVLDDMPEVGVVVGYRDKDNLLGLVLDRLPGYARPVKTQVDAATPEPTPSWAGGDTEGTATEGVRTRAMVKIEDGCNDFCTFCIIPFTRGMPRSTPTGEVVRLVNERLEEGYKEIVLTGVHMGKYGTDHAQRKGAAASQTEAHDLPGVVAAVLERTRVPRLRITSVEPTDAIMMLPLLGDMSYAGRLAAHLHLPLQSGCDATLARMKRDYTTAEYSEVVTRCREAVLGISITTDLIVGFPGESGEEWGETLRFVESMEFAKIHVFPYSKRPNTPAAGMAYQVPPDVAQARTHEAIALGERMEAAYAIRHLGRTLPILWEHPEGDLWSGLSGNYLRVHTRTSRNLHNQITPATITHYDHVGLWAELHRGEPA